MEDEDNHPTNPTNNNKVTFNKETAQNWISKQSLPVRVKLNFDDTNYITRSEANSHVNKYDTKYLPESLMGCCFTVFNKEYVNNNNK